MDPSEVSCQPIPGWLEKQAWLYVEPPFKNDEDHRLPANYIAVAQQFRVLDAKRYEPHFEKGEHVTYCNIFFSDVMTAMHTPPSHWVSLTTGENMPVGKPAEELRLSKNHPADLIGWLRRWGPQNRWRQATWQEAVTNADLGRPSCITYEAPIGRTGHVAVLLPGGVIAQAGAHNLWRSTVAAGFGNLPLEYWIHP
jgi:hypothetical protein